jgi:hypothetical protein
MINLSWAQGAGQNGISISDIKAMSTFRENGLKLNLGLTPAVGVVSNFVTHL